MMGAGFVPVRLRECSCGYKPGGDTGVRRCNNFRQHMRANPRHQEVRGQPNRTEGG